MPDTPIPTPAIDVELRERVLSLGLARRLAEPVQPQSVNAELLEALTAIRDSLSCSPVRHYGSFTARSVTIGSSQEERIRAVIARAEVRS